MKADNNPLNTLEAFYVGSSRHKDNLAIVTDDKDQLLRIISEKLDLASERIEFKEPLKMQVVDPQTIIEQELNVKPSEAGKAQVLERSKQVVRPCETQNTQKQAPNKIQRERERGGRGR